MLRFVIALFLGSACFALEPGESWNESRSYRDPVSGLEVRQLTTRGIYNQGPTVHMNTAFPGGGHEVLFASFRDGASLLMTGDLESGAITVRHAIPAVRPDVDGRKLFLRNIYYQGLNIAASARHRKVAAISQEGNELVVVNLDDNSIKKFATEDGWIAETPVFSADGAEIAYCSRSVSLRGKERELAQRPMFYRMLRTDGSGKRMLYFNSWGQGHIFPHPSDIKLWIVKYGRPEFYFRGKEREQAFRRPDMYRLHPETAVTEPVLPRNRNKRIDHLSWSSGGNRIVYHGKAEEGGNFIGAMDLNGTVVWEYVFGGWSFERNGSNHICGDPAGEFIFDDGLAVPGQISLIDYRNAGPDGAPAVHPVARWENDWRGLSWQLSHPHPAISPDGRFLVFYGCKDGKINVYSVDVSPLREKLAEPGGRRR